MLPKTPSSLPDLIKINIGQIVIKLWQNILRQQHVALNSLLTTLPDRNFYCEAVHGLILYCIRIRKNITYREQTENRETNYRGHSVTVLMERRVEGANRVRY